MPVAIPLAVTAAPPKFEVAIAGQGAATFTDLVALSQAHDPSTKGGGKKCTLIVRRPATNTTEFSGWLELAILDPEPNKKSVSVNVVVGGNPTMRFHMTKAFPTKVEITSEGKSGVLMETVTMTCELMQRVNL